MLLVIYWQNECEFSSRDMLNLLNIFWAWQNMVVRYFDSLKVWIFGRSRMNRRLRRFVEIWVRGTKYECVRAMLV